MSAAHIDRIETWNSGAGVELDIVELDMGPTLVVSDDTIAVYRSTDDFWAEVENADYRGERRIVTFARETGQPLSLESST